jgi:16S rRNA (cytosine967-C5)-methyltransferase
VQDYSSQLVAPFLQVEPGMRVVDACAGGGGKSLHLAALMKNQGKIISLDTEADKLVRLRERATRAKTNIIETRAIEGAKTIKRLYDSADRLLLDVPCTGMGVLRRNPDAKWKLTPEFYQEVLETQYQILSRYSPIIKPGGYLVYATCSVLPTENRNQVDRFLNEYSGFEFIEDRSILPQDDGYDGFYMALIKRN